MQEGGNNSQGMEPGPVDDGCIWTIGVHYDKVHLHNLWADLDGQPNYALWNDKLLVEAH